MQVWKMQVCEYEITIQVCMFFKVYRNHIQAHMLEYNLEICEWIILLVWKDARLKGSLN